MREIELSSGLRQNLGVQSLMVPDDTSDEDALIMLRDAISAPQAPTPPIEEQKETRSFIENRARDIARGTLGVAEGVTAIGEFVGYPLAAEASDRLNELKQNLAPDGFDPRPLFRIKEEEGLGEAIGEAATRLPSQITEFLPQLASFLIPAAIISKVGKGVGFAKAAGASIFVTAGAQEGAGALRQAKEQGASVFDQKVVFASTLLVTGALNRSGLGVALRKLPDKTITGIIGRVASSGGVEAVTEYLEEPAQVAIFKAVGLDADFKEAMLAGLDVIPVSFFIGGAIGGANVVFTPLTTQEITEGENAENLQPIEDRFEFSENESRNLANFFNVSGSASNANENLISVVMGSVARGRGETNEEFKENTTVSKEQGLIAPGSDRPEFTRAGFIDTSGGKSINDGVALQAIPDELGFFLRSANILRTAPSNLFNNQGMAPADRIRKFFSQRISKEEMNALQLDEIIPEGSQELVGRDELELFIAENAVEVREHVRGFTREQIESRNEVLIQMDLLRDTGIRTDFFSRNRPNFFFSAALLSEFNPIEIELALQENTINQEQAALMQKIGRVALKLGQPAEFTNDDQNIPGGTNHRNIILTAKMDTIASGHFADAGTYTGTGQATTIGWIRTSDRFIDVKKFLMIEEIQSDVGQAIESSEGLLSFPPGFPFPNTWRELLVKRALIIAAREGYQGIILPEGMEHIRRGAGEKIVEISDKKVPNLVNKVMKQWGNGEKIRLFSDNFELGNEIIQERLEANRDTGMPQFALTTANGIRGHRLEFTPIGIQRIITRGMSVFKDEVRDGLSTAKKGDILGFTAEGAALGRDDILAGKAVKFLVRGFLAADVGTAFHEFAHLAAFKLQGPVKRAAEKAFAGGKPIEKWNLKEHEKWAVTFEAFMYTGTTSNKELRNCFQIIQEELRKIYRGTKEILTKGPYSFTLKGKAAKFRAIDMLFETPFRQGDFAQELGSLMQIIDGTAGIEDRVDELRKTKRINGINIANLSTLLEDDEIIEIIGPLLEKMGKGGTAAAVPWEVTVGMTMEEFNRNPKDFITRIIKKTRAQVPPQPHEVLGMIAAFVESSSVFVKLVTSDVGPDQQIAFDKYRDVIAKTIQDAGSMTGRALNAFKIFAAVKDLENALKVVERELEPKELEALASLDMTNLREIKEFMETVKAPNKAAAKKGVLALFYNAMLFNPGTIGVNTLSNIAHVAYQAGNISMIGTIDSIASKITGRPQQTYASEGFQIFGALMRGLTFQNPVANREFVLALKGEIENTAATDYDDIVNSNTITAFEELMDQIGLGKFGKTTTGRFVAGILNGGTRALIAMDLWTKAVAREAYLGNLEFDGSQRGIFQLRIDRELEAVARRNGVRSSSELTKDKIAQTQEEILSRIASDDLWIGMSSGHKNVFRDLEKKFKKDNGRFPNGVESMSIILEEINPPSAAIPRKIMQKFIDPKIEKVLANAKRQGREPTENELRKAREFTPGEILEIRKEAAVQRRQNHFTFQDAPGKHTRAIIEMRNDFGFLGRAVVPFINTVMNLTKRSAELTPVLGVFTGPKFANLKPAEVAAKQIQGLVLSYVIMSLMREGWITGPPPEDEGERESNRRQGIPPWSLRLPGEVWVDYRRFDPFATPIAMIANTVEELKRIERDKGDPSRQEQDTFDALSRLAGGLTNTFIETTWFQNMFQFAGTDRDLKQRAARQLGSFVPYSSLWRSIYRSHLASTEGVPVLDRPSFVEMWGQSTGFGRGGLVKLDLFGEEVRRGPGIPAAWLPPDHPLASTAALAGGLFPGTAPFAASQQVTDVVENEFIVTGIYPTLPDRTVKLPGFKETQRFDEEVWRQYVIRSGRRLRDAIEDVIKKESYINLEPEQRGIVLDNLYRKIRASELLRAKAAELKLRREQGPQEVSIEGSAALARRLLQ